MFAATADGLLLAFRREVSDVTEPYLWEDAEAYAYMTEGFDRLLKKADVKYTTLRLAFTADEPTVALPASLLHIRHARVVGGGALQAASAGAHGAARDDYGLQGAGADPMFSGTGPPRLYVRDYERRALRLVPIPSVSGELEIQGTATLSTPLDEGVPLPTADAEDLRLVLHFMKALAYTKHDAETEDMSRAKFHEDRFYAGVQDRESSLRNYRRPPGVVRMEWP